ncbi:MAG: hypothetical protein HYY40_08305 [Bacteroidetes bacterium]|nr:hypothetical protein [Bacteroidota bacterium]
MSGSRTFKALLNTYRGLVKRNPGNSRLLMARGVLYHLFGMHKKALKDFNRLLALRSGTAAIYFLRSDCYFNLGNFMLAWKDLMRGRMISIQNGSPGKRTTRAKYIHKPEEFTPGEKAEIAEILHYERNRIFYTLIPDIFLPPGSEKVK